MKSVLNPQDLKGLSDCKGLSGFYTISSIYTLLNHDFKQKYIMLNSYRSPY